MAHSDDIKAACMAALLAGQGVDAVSKMFKIPQQTVSDWKKACQSGKYGIKKRAISEIVLGLLEENLETLRTQVVAFRNEKWLADQSASEVAVLHGVIADKTFRILDSFVETEEPEDSTGQHQTV
jgi:transposase-like protein